MHYDVVVIGAGPGGSTAAYTLAKEGARVLLVDSRKEVGYPVQCAEFVPVQLYYKFPEFFSPETIVQKVNNMVHFTPWGEITTMYSEGFILNRTLWDKKIAGLATKEGAELMLKTKFIGFDGNFVFLKDLGKNEMLKVSANSLIGADGARSTVARLTGEYTKNFLITAQYTLRLKKKLRDLLIFFRDYIPGGYGWIFPKGDVANVGVGIDLDYKLDVVEVLNKFVKELEDFIYIKPILGRTGGFIPGEGVIEPVRGRVLLVGDAGGFCHPITGGGIANAVLTGDMAGRAILEGEIQEYEEESMDTLGQSINRAAEKRRRYMKEWDNLKFRIPKTWIAFEEYYKD
ncbi:MAG TPA: NAD(P)/FAD-dependent oxidoreductase [Aquifex aeolicus]|nr:NAD(P)/FAD-dependent oxidoreductase [Aquifex aeolicus]